jgi:septum formation protein
MIEKLHQKQIILASNSPRRKELLSSLKIPFQVVVRNTDEFVTESISAEETAKFLAVKKASFYNDITNVENTILITADTIVLVDKKILGKPASYNDAFNMLRSLSGRPHKVITGTAITSAKKQVVFDAVTTVYFKKLSDEEIDFYITNFKPFDKAGAYGIQEWIGMIGITRIEGSYFNVVGLPVQKLYSELIKF